MYKPSSSTQSSPAMSTSPLSSSSDTSDTEEFHTPSSSHSSTSSPPSNASCHTPFSLPSSSITEKYEARVAETTERVDPNRSKANAALKDEDNMEIEELSGAFNGFKEPMPVETDNYMDAPLLTIRELMPGATGGDDEDNELD